MKFVLAGLCLIGLLALSQSPTPSTPVAVSAAQTTSAGANSTSIVDDQDELSAICPLKWTCDDTGGYYSTRAACTAACSTPCYRDYACTAGCICP